MLRKTITSAAAVLAVSLPAAFTTPAAAQETFRIAWSIYVGWMPWAYAEEQGIMDKWADKYGIDVEIVQINDYIESINQYTAGAFDGVVMTNMDALTIPAVGGVDTTVLIVGDFSNGNDGIVLKDGTTVDDLVGEKINLVELSVSHYLLARALESIGKTERDVSVENTSDADIVSVFKASADVTNVVTWNPLLAEVVAEPGASLVFDSADIPGEIIDTLSVNTEVLAANPELGKALTGAWFEVMSIMAKDDAAGIAAREFMATAAGTDLAGYDAQLATTRMFYDPADAVDFSKSPDLAATMDNVRNFSFDVGLLGAGAPDADIVGIELPDGTILGDPANVKLRFSEEFMAMAARGEL